jgi:hypothetical protein
MLAALTDFYARYADAFMRQDTDALVAAWSFPAAITGPTGNKMFDAMAFRRNVEALFGFYQRQDVAKATADVAAMHPLGDGVVLGQIDYAMFTAAGAPVAAWQTPYLLRDAGAGLKAFAAVADGEIAAWAARGTPLGSR